MYRNRTTEGPCIRPYCREFALRGLEHCAQHIPRCVLPSCQEPLRFVDSVQSCMRGHLQVPRSSQLSRDSAMPEQTAATGVAAPICPACSKPAERSLDGLPACACTGALWAIQYLRPVVAAEPLPASEQPTSWRVAWRRRQSSSLLLYSLEAFARAEMCLVPEPRHAALERPLTALGRRYRRRRTGECVRGCLRTYGLRSCPHEPVLTEPELIEEDKA